MMFSTSAGMSSIRACVHAINAHKTIEQANMDDKHIEQANMDDKHVTFSGTALMECHSSEPVCKPMRMYTYRVGEHGTRSEVQFAPTCHKYQNSSL